jgi:hypothetical protein
MNDIPYDGNNVSDEEDLLQELEETWKGSWSRDNFIKKAEDDTRDEELHPSSSPFCSYRYLMDLLKWGESEYRNYPSKMEYYCEIGTIAHLVFQKTFMNHAHDEENPEVKIIGDYECTNCDAKFPFSFTHLCTKCGSPTRYEELGVRYGKRVHGHIDYVIQYLGKYYILDFKTSSVALIQSAYRCKDKGYKSPLPYPKNLFQVLSYGSYCENGGLRYGNIEIEGIILLYASRDNPMQNYYFHYENFGKWRSLLKKYIMISDNMFDLSRKIFKAVKKGKEIDKKHIEKIAKYKLCSSVEEYESTYMDKYDVCPYVATCMSSTCKRLTKAIDNYVLADEG